jgi:cholesterol transport system auxiliary component
MARTRWVGAARWAATLVVGGLLASCGGGGSPQSSATAYDLTAASPGPKHALRATVNVLQPAASGDLDSERVLVRTGPNDLAVLAGARWSDPLPVLIHSRLRAIFNSAEDSQAAGAAGGKEYNLETDVRAFELIADAKRVKIDIAVKLISASSGRIVATRTFEAQAAVSSTDPQVVTAALDGALEGVLAKIFAFVASSV